MNIMRIYPEFALIFFVQVKLKLVLNIAIFLMANSLTIRVVQNQ